MKVGLLLCDHVPEEFKHIDGEYRQMFERLLPSLDFEPYYVFDNHFPGSVSDHDVYLCNGSRHSVYDDMEWIKRLKQFVKNIHDHKKKFIGICFGHQMITHALDGVVGKALNGWCVGVHSFQILHENWMQPALDQCNMLMLNQDQVLKLPENSKVMATSGDCKVGMFLVNDRMLGIQAHPEFSKKYNKALIVSRMERIGPQKVKEGIKSLKATLHSEIVAQWMLNFIQE